MAKISTYPQATPPAGTDLLIGTDVTDSNATKNFKISDVLSLGSQSYSTVGTETGNPLAYTFVVGDAGKYIQVSSVGAGSVRIPLNSAVAFAIGTEISIINTGATVITITGSLGVTLRYYSPSAAATPNLPGGLGTSSYRACTLKKVATDEWHIIGNLA